MVKRTRRKETTSNNAQNWHSFWPMYNWEHWRDQRVEFTVLGDTVNVANRLCDACKKSDSQVIISDAVAKRLSEEIKSDFEANFSIPGRTEKIGIHKLQL